MDTGAEPQSQQRRTGVISPQASTPRPAASGPEVQKLFTFTAPMSFRGGTDSRFTPESFGSTWSRTGAATTDGGVDGQTAHFSPGSIRRRLAPLATSAPMEDVDGMDCCEDATNGAVAALLGLGNRI
jgi:hypothetical protein